MFSLQHLKKIKKLVILGVGSELMQDDAAGVIISQNLINKYGEENPNLRIYAGHSTPENYTGLIKQFQPDHVIIIDAAELHLQPGTLTLLPVHAINESTLGTHKLSLVMMVKYLNETIKCDFSVVAIQYKSIEFNAKMTKEVKAGVKKATILLSEIINEYFLTK